MVAGVNGNNPDNDQALFLPKCKRGKRTWAGKFLQHCAKV